MILFTFVKEVLHINEKKEQQHTIRKHRYETILDNPNSKLGFILNVLIIFLILLSIAFIIFESIGDYSVRYSKFLFISDGIISSLFAIEYFYRLFNSREKLGFVAKPMNIIDLVAFLPFFLEVLFTGMIDMTFLKALRILRVFRIFKLVRHFKSVHHIIAGLKNYKAEYQVSGILVMIVLLLSAILMYHVEGGVNEGFSSIPQTIWWSIVTMTTVGYGDTYPVTIAGKILGGVIILIGPMVIAMLSSITVLVFFEVAEKNKKSKLEAKMKPCPRCFTTDNPIDSHYCRKCGKKLIEIKVKNKTSLDPV